MKKFIIAAILALFVFNSAFSIDSVIHTVDRGETLASIAKLYGVTEADIIKVNPTAAQYIYVGMDLEIPLPKEETEKAVPQSSSATQSVVTRQLDPQPQPNYQTQQSQQTAYQTPYHNYQPTYFNEEAFEAERTKRAFEVIYMLGDFSDAKYSSRYGFAGHNILWRIAPRLYGGLYYMPLMMNFGIVDSKSTSFIGGIGPSVTYYFTPKTFFSLPLMLDYWIYDSYGKTRLAFGMILNPRIYLGSTMGVFIGPQLLVDFKHGSASFGLTVGLFF